MSKVKEAMKRRHLTSKCETPICGAKCDETLDCKSFDITRCHWLCVKEMERDGIQLDLFEPTDEDLEEMYQSDKVRRDLTVNMDEEEGRNG